MRLRLAMPSWVDKEGMDVALGKACWDMCDAGVGDERRVEMRERDVDDYPIKELEPML